MCPETTTTIQTTVDTQTKENTTWAFTANYGMPIGSEFAKKPVTWPPQAFFRGRSRQFVAELYIKRIEWHEDGDGTIDAIKLTLSDGQSSPKIGLHNANLDKSLTFNNVNAIRGLVVISTPKKIVQIELIDANKEPFATIGKNSQKRVSTSAEQTRQRLKLKTTERLIGLQAVEHKPPQNSNYAPLAGIKFLILSYKP
jgi:hypothetical protein